MHYDQCDVVMYLFIHVNSKRSNFMLSLGVKKWLFPRFFLLVPAFGLTRTFVINLPPFPLLTWQLAWWFYNVIFEAQCWSYKRVSQQCRIQLKVMNYIPVYQFIAPHFLFMSFNYINFFPFNMSPCINVLYREVFDHCKT